MGRRGKKRGGEYEAKGVKRGGGNTKKDKKTRWVVEMRSKEERKEGGKVGKVEGERGREIEESM